MNNQQGDAFEKMILAGCATYKKRGRALIEKTPEPCKIIKKEAGGRAIVQFQKHEKAQCDFKGVLNDGRAVIFESKATTEKRMNQDRLSSTQFKQLAEYEKMGAVAGVCVLINKTAAFIPFSIWSNMKTIYGRKYITEEEAEVFQVDTPSTIQFLNYVDVNRIVEFIDKQEAFICND
ncbi:Holliday junction resolvase RecU [Enterococcus sp. BWM-S5]|uniref:Holliday junction resolvase RecU n=1 Tax=Enterococcus larvae TaxID=2794352 RepID=A0ABS4CIK2_9ENTE|nr:Holliday junction resolvase RecU [Enterococcus larvae]MBP1046427.1 Holliday junction resolvase RecU [Enterococcus larvae]